MVGAIDSDDVFEVSRVVFASIDGISHSVGA